MNSYYLKSGSPSQKLQKKLQKVPKSSKNGQKNAKTSRFCKIKKSGSPSQKLPKNGRKSKKKPKWPKNTKNTRFLPTLWQNGLKVGKNAKICIYLKTSWRWWNSKRFSLPWGEHTWRATRGRRSSHRWTPWNFEIRTISCEILKKMGPNMFIIPDM